MNKYICTLGHMYIMYMHTYIIMYNSYYMCIHTYVAMYVYAYIIMLTLICSCSLNNSSLSYSTCVVVVDPVMTGSTKSHQTVGLG